MTDFSFDNLGVPRNTRIPATAAPEYCNLGLCDPDRTDLAMIGESCGAFKVPSLRNVRRNSMTYPPGSAPTSTSRKRHSAASAAWRRR
ncbi:hypothetical protein [Janthinobacterium sp. DSP2-3-3]|uniref:hypothetical protein n=1 Tax=Janthinobacterium sp. DSP2-3-3 TaxID=2804596 RepID=UPI003CF4AD5F